MEKMVEFMTRILLRVSLYFFALLVSVLQKTNISLGALILLFHFHPMNMMFMLSVALLEEARSLLT